MAVTGQNTRRSPARAENYCESKQTHFSYSLDKAFHSPEFQAELFFTPNRVGWDSLLIPSKWLFLRKRTLYINERITSIFALPQTLMIEGGKDEFGDLTKPGRFFGGIHASAFLLRRAIDVLQSINPKRKQRILQITSLRISTVYSKNA